MSPLTIVGSQVWGRLGLMAIALVGGLVLAGCSGPSKPKPARLNDFKSELSLKVVWQSSAGRTSPASSGQGWFSPGVSDGLVVIAERAGVVRAFDLSTGTSKWTVDLKAPIQAGVASGGGAGEGSFAVVTQAGDLALIDSKGELRWRVPLGGLPLEAPVLSGGHAVVRLADNRVVAWSLVSGERRWVFQRTLPSLVLHGQSGMRGIASTNEEASGEGLGVADLLVGLPGGRLAWLSGANGSLRWETQAAVPRGSNEVERIADLLGAPSIFADTVCVSAYQTQVACHGVENGRPIWQKRFAGALPLAIDQRLVVAVDSSDRITAFERSQGESLWTQEGLFLRRLSAPVSFDRAIWVADGEGYLHGLSRENGQFIARMRLDAKPSGPMRVTKQGLVVQTESGRLYLLRP